MAVYIAPTSATNVNESALTSTPISTQTPIPSTDIHLINHDYCETSDQLNFTFTINSTLVSGDLIVLAMGLISEGNYSRVVSITQNNVNWNFATSQLYDLGYSVEIWYGYVNANPSQTFAMTLHPNNGTVNPAGERVDSRIYIYVYSGLSTSNALDKIASATGIIYINTNQATATSTGITSVISNSPELAVGVILDNPFGTDQHNPTNNFTLYTTGSDRGGVSVVGLSKIITSNVIVTSETTVTSESRYVGAIATFKAIESTPTPTPQIPEFSIFVILLAFVIVTMILTIVCKIKYSKFNETEKYNF